MGKSDKPVIKIKNLSESSNLDSFFMDDALEAVKKRKKFMKSIKKNK